MANAELINIAATAIDFLESAERETYWCGGDPYGESASETLMKRFGIATGKEA